MPDIGVPQGPPMGDSPAPDAGAGGTPPSGDSVPVTPPQGAPMSPESVTAVGSHATGRAKMGVALLLINQAMKDFSPGSEDHMHALEMFQKGVKHFKQQEPLTPSAPQMQRPSMPGMPGAGGPPGMGGPPGGMPSLPQPPRGPIPAPMGAM